ncbi:MAG: threonine aldolase [Enterobacterales bacterium]|jgi:threonine aldolase
MLSEAPRANYLKVISNCGKILFRHPQRTMAERLKAIIPLAESFGEVDNYGVGEFVNQFENEVAMLLGHEAAVFLPSGTMAQVMALKIWADEKQCNNVAFHPTSHLQLHEQLAYQELYHLNGILTGADEKVISTSDLDSLDVELAALLLELPMREIGGQLPSWEELKAQREWATNNNVALHLDGARLWSCETYYQKSLSEIAGLFDSAYVSFYKDLDGIAGAMLLGSTEFIEKARVWARRCGGNIVTQFPNVMAAIDGLSKHLPLMPEYVVKAGIIAEYFGQQDNIELIPGKPQTNLFHLVIDQAPELIMPKIAQWSNQNNIALLPLPRSGRTPLCKNSSRFEITIGQNALAQENNYWKNAIEKLSVFI